MTLLHGRDARVDVVNHLATVAATKHIFATVFHSHQKAVCCLAVVSKVFAEVTLSKPAPIAQETTAATNANSTHRGWANEHRSDAFERQSFFKAESTVHLNCIVCHFYTERTITQ